MRGDISSASVAKRHPLDWYVDETWCAEQLAVALDGFADDRAAGLAIWDPSCGYGNTVDALMVRGFRCYLSDVVENVAWDRFNDPDHPEDGEVSFFSADFLETTAAPAPCSIVCNPPYSYRKGIAEAFVRHALKLATGRVCMLVAGKWLAPGVDKKRWSKRSRLFRIDHPPQLVLHFSTRPSMPPGDEIEAMGKRAFKGGVIDYCWIVWDVRRPTLPGETRTIWLPPLGEAS